MKVVDADKIKGKHPNRRSLNTVLEQAPVVSITKQIDSICEEMCKNYCKMPYKYSVNEWEEIQCSEDSPCNNCPLSRL